MCKVRPTEDSGGMLLNAIRRGDKEHALDLLLSRTSGWEPWELSCQERERDGTPLYHAAARGDPTLVDLLLTFGALVNVRTAWGANPLHAAADRNRASIVRTLLMWGCDRTAKTESGDTPAHVACYRGHTEIVRLLLEDGCNPNIKNNRGNTPLEEALSNPGNSQRVRQDVGELVKLYSRRSSSKSPKKERNDTCHRCKDTYSSKKGN